MATSVLDVSHLTKRFGEFTAVDDISFSVKEGEIVGLLGPNGAGKTTTIQMLLGLITPTKGAISYFGNEFSKHREFSLSRINFASAYTQVNGKLSVWENLRIFAGLYQVEDISKKITHLLELFEIEHVAHEIFWHLSSGQKTRVILAKALLNDPKLILMDEPTASLDPDIAQKVMELIERLKTSKKIAMLYTSHDMDEVERLCDRVMFLSRGRVIAEDTPLGLTKRVGKSQLTLTFDGAKKAVAAFLRKKRLVHTFPRPQVVNILLADSEIPGTLFGLSSDGVWLTEIDVQKPDLEDVFLSIVKGTYES